MTSFFSSDDSDVAVNSETPNNDQQLREAPGVGAVPSDPLGTNISRCRRMRWQLLVERCDVSHGALRRPATRYRSLCDPRQLGAGTDAQLAVRRSKMALDGPHRQHQLMGDLAIRQPASG